MTTETMNELKTHIMNQTCIMRPMFSICRIMKCYDMETWTQRCMDKIADELLIDGEHVMVDVLNASPNIVIDADGIVICEGILSKYLSEENYSELKRYADWYTEHVRCKNEVIETMRGYCQTDLRRLIKDAKENEDYQQIWELLVAERKSRYWWRRVFRVIRKWVDNKWIYLKNYKFVRLFKKTLKQMQKEESEKEVREALEEEHVSAVEKISENAKKTRGEIINDAYQRFVKNHGAPEYLQGDDLKKYVYLSVNYFARRKWSERHITESGEEYEFRYLLIKPAMEAIGRLTPRELQQMFPVIKNYDGEKYGSKDYFYARKAMEKSGMDNPIGDEVRTARFLWDYDNDALSFFLIQWVSCINALHLYAGKSELSDAFYRSSKSESEGLI